MLNKYAQHLGLESYDVYHECDPLRPEFFEVSGVLNETFGYGKHAFTIAIKSDDASHADFRRSLSLKEKSNKALKLYCWRGGMRSQMTSKWLTALGIENSLIQIKNLKSQLKRCLALLEFQIV